MEGVQLKPIVGERGVREAPEKIERLFEHWKRLRGTVLLDAKSLAALAGDLNALNPSGARGLGCAVWRHYRRNRL